MTRSSWPYYVAPMAAFLVLGSLEGALPRSSYPFVYAAKVLIVGILTILCSKTWRTQLKWNVKAIGIGLVAGLLGLGLWLGLDALQPAGLALGKRTAYNPFEAIADPNLRYSFIAMRFVGLAVLVPIVEEVFWRSFLLRFLTDHDRWEEVALDSVTLAAFGIAAGAFAIAHPEWLAALGYAALATGVLRYTKSLAACVVTHAVTNAALGIFVLKTGSWHYW